MRPQHSLANMSTTPCRTCSDMWIMLLTLKPLQVQLLQEGIHVGVAAAVLTVLKLLRWWGVPCWVCQSAGLVLMYVCARTILQAHAKANRSELARAQQICCRSHYSSKRVHSGCLTTSGSTELSLRRLSAGSGASSDHCTITQRSQKDIQAMTRGHRWSSRLEKEPTSAVLLSSTCCMYHLL